MHTIAPRDNNFCSAGQFLAGVADSRGKWTGARQIAQTGQHIERMALLD